MGSRSKKSVFYTVSTNISRVVLALVMVLSGFVKAVDPKGTMYKLQEYTNVFSIEAFSDDWLLFFAIVLAAMEFLIGVFLLMGVYRKFIVTVVLLVFVLFTPFTLYMTVANPMADCGCFGDAFKMPNWLSFLKNLFLFALALIVFMGRRRFICNITAKNRWMVTLFAVAYVAFIEGISLSFVPVLDFRNYAVGNNLRELVQGKNDIYRAVLTYEKDGVQREFAQDSLPDETWSFVDGRSELVAKGEAPVVGDFSILEWSNDYDIAEDVLADTGFVCIVVSEMLEDASVGRVDKINDLFDYSQEYGISFLAATSSDEDEIQLWRKRTGAEYPIYWADNMMLRAITRANPGVMLLKDGVVVGKWNVENMPDETDMFSLDAVEGRSRAEVFGIPGLRFWLLVLIVPLVFISLVDILTGRKKKEKKAEVPENTENTNNDI